MEVALERQSRYSFHRIQGRLVDSVVSGCHIGFGHRFIWIVQWPFHRRQSSLSRMALGMFFLAQHSHRFTDADHDLPHFQFPLDSRCAEAARTRTRRISMARTLPFAASPCGLVRRRTIRNFVDLDQSRCPNHRGQFRDQRKGRRFTPKESLLSKSVFFQFTDDSLFWHFLRTQPLASKNFLFAG